MAADTSKQLQISNVSPLFTSCSLTADEIVKQRLIRQLERATVCEAAAVTRRPLITDLLRRSAHIWPIKQTAALRRIKEARNLD